MLVKVSTIHTWSTRCRIFVPRCLKRWMWWGFKCYWI